MGDSLAVGDGVTSCVVFSVWLEDAEPRIAELPEEGETDLVTARALDAVGVTAVALMLLLAPDGCEDVDDENERDMDCKDVCVGDVDGYGE